MEKGTVFVSESFFGDFKLNFKIGVRKDNSGVYVSEYKSNKEHGRNTNHYNQ